MSKQPPSMTAFAAMSLILIIALACAPAAPPQQETSQTQTQTPQPTRQATPPPEDAAISTPTPAPVVGTPETPKAVGQPTPTADTNLRKALGLGPKPTQNPASLTTGEHPQGIEGCRTLNIHSATYDEIRTLSWCAEELIEDVIEQCSDTSGSTAYQEFSCAKNALANVESYILREYMVPCMAISTTQERDQCRQDVGAAYAAHTRKFEETWTTILYAVHDDDDVKLRRAAADQCVREAGKEPLDDEPFPWQQMDEEKTRKYKVEMTTAEREALVARYRVIDQCATSQGLYESQEGTWINELQRLSMENPDAVRPLFDEGIKTILEEDGIALLLSLDPPSGG